MGSEDLHKGKVNADLLASHIHGVHEVFSTTVGEGFQGRLVDRQLGEVLPAVSDDPVLVIALAAGKVEHEAFAADGFYEVGEACGLKAAFAENPRGDDDMRGACIEPAGGVVGIHASAELESAGKRSESFASGGFIAWAKLDDMAAAQVILAIQLSVPRGGVVGNKVGLRALVRKRTADNLFHPSLMQIDTGPKHRGKIEGERPMTNAKIPFRLG